MRFKVSSLVLASAAMAFLALTAIPAVASTTTTFNVPFSFTVEGKTLPAGEYSVQRDTAGTFVKLQGKDSSLSFTWIANAAASGSNRTVLKFDELGQTHALQSVQCGPLVTRRLDKKVKGVEHITQVYAPGA